MSQDPLIPRETLLQVKDELQARIARLSPSLTLEPGAVGDALSWALLFERWPELLPGPHLDREVIFYNQYFWFKRFVALKQTCNGFDAGLEQQLFKLLEQIDFEPNWDVIKYLDSKGADLREQGSI